MDCFQANRSESEWFCLASLIISRSCRVHPKESWQQTKSTYQWAMPGNESKKGCSSRLGRPPSLKDPLGSQRKSIQEKRPAIGETAGEASCSFRYSASFASQHASFGVKGEGKNHRETAAVKGPSNPSHSPTCTATPRELPACFPENSDTSKEKRSQLPIFIPHPRT